MNLRKLLMVLTVIALAGATWLWVTRTTPVVKDLEQARHPSITGALRIEPPVTLPLTVVVTPPLQAGETIDGLLSNETLGERELLAGLTKIVLATARKSEERNEALSHLLNLTDEDHESVLLVLARDPSLEVPLGRRLFEDAFNRSLSWQLDLGLVLLERKDMETLHASVRDHLLFLLGPDVAADSDLKTLKQAGIAAKKQWAEQAAQ
jgi:hypothetical protein